MLDNIINDSMHILASEATVALLLLLVISGVAAVFVSRRHDEKSTFEWFVAFAVIAGILSVTLFRGEFDLGFHPKGLTQNWTIGLASMSQDPFRSSQFVLNIALFVPAAIVWTWSTTRAVRVLLLLVAGSFVVECLQAITGTGINTLVDMIANSLGAFVGVGAVSVISFVVDGCAGRLPRARQFQLAGAITIAITLVVTGWFGGAARRQENVRATVTEHVSDVDSESLLHVMRNDPGKASDIDIIPGVTADGFMSSDGQTTYRFPASFFSLRRCVYATWVGDNVEIRDASGSDCSDSFL